MTPEQYTIAMLEAELEQTREALESAWSGIWDGHYSVKGVAVDYAQSVDKEVKRSMHLWSSDAMNRNIWN